MKHISLFLTIALLLGSAGCNTVEKKVTVKETPQQRLDGLQKDLQKMDAAQLQQTVNVLQRMQKNAVLLQFNRIMDDADKLLGQNSTDKQQQWNALARRMKRFKLDNPAYQSYQAVINRLQRFVAQFPRYRLKPGLIEPAGTFDASRGFSGPVQLTFEGSSGNYSGPQIKLTVEAGRSIQLAGEQSRIGTVYTGRSLPLQIRSASVDTGQNFFHIAAAYSAKRFLNEIIPAISDSTSGEVVVQPDKLTLQSVSKQQQEFVKLIREAAGLTDSNSPRVVRLAAALGSLLNDYPQLVKLQTNRQMVRTLSSVFPGGRCRLSVDEPREPLYTTTGFTSPVQVELAADQAGLLEYYRPALTVSSGSELRFRNGDRTRTVSWQSNTSKIKVRIKITTADREGSRNRLYFSVDYRYKPLMKVLQKYFPAIAPGLSLSTDQYLLAARIGGSNNLYGSTSGYGAKYLLHSDSTNKIQSQVALAHNGLFTIGGKYSNAPYDLMYGHPNGSGPDKIWSSFISVKVDDRVYRFHELPKISMKKQKNGSVVTAAKTPEGMIVRQTLYPFATAGQAHIRIAVSVSNTTTNSHSVGVRYLVDTWAGMNDGVPFLIPGSVSSKIHTHEVEFTPAWSSIWQTYELPVDSSGTDASTLCMQNVTVGKGLIPPDRTAFASWPRAYKSEWDYYVDKNYRVTGDTAVLLWWKPVAVAPGKLLKTATRFGVTGQSDGPMLYVTDREKGQGILVLRYRNKTSSGQQLQYTLFCTEGELIHTGNNTITGRVAPNATYMRSLPVNVISRGNAKVVVALKQGNQTRRWEFRMKGKPQPNTIYSIPVAAEYQTIPIRFFAKGSKKKLAARLLNSAGRQVNSAVLRPRKWMDGYLYTGQMRIPSGVDGRTVLEVFEL